jgi:CDP-glucose 4,6-dehydratase
MGGFDPYSSSKGCAELVTAAYRNSFFNPLRYNEHNLAVASVRAGNVIGGGDWAENRLIPDIFRNIYKGNTVVIRNPAAIRPWQHVLEPLSGYLLLAEKLFTNGVEYAEAWNFGPRHEDAKNVQWIFDNIARKWGKEIKWEIDKSVTSKHEANYLKLDISKAISLLSWEPKLNMDQTIDKIVSWYTAYISGENMRDVTLEQIKNYEKNN